MTDGQTMGVGQLTAPILALPLRFPRDKWQTRTQAHTYRHAHTLTGTDRAREGKAVPHVRSMKKRPSCSWPPRRRSGESQVPLPRPVKSNLWSAHRWNAPARTRMLHVHTHTHTLKTHLHLSKVIYSSLDLFFFVPRLFTPCAQRSDNAVCWFEGILKSDVYFWKILVTGSRKPVRYMTSLRPTVQH